MVLPNSIGETRQLPVFSQWEVFFENGDAHYD